MLKATSYVIQKKSALKQLYQKKKNSIRDYNLSAAASFKSIGSGVVAYRGNRITCQRPASLGAPSQMLVTDEMHIPSIAEDDCVLLT